MNIPQVRQLVVRAVADRQLAPPTLIGETVLIRDGFYVGRRFIFEGLEAIWLLDEPRVFVHSDADEAPALIDLETLASERPAA